MMEKKNGDGLPPLLFAKVGLTEKLQHGVVFLYAAMSNHLQRRRRWMMNIRKDEGSRRLTAYRLVDRVAQVRSQRRGISQVTIEALLQMSKIQKEEEEVDAEACAQR